MLSSPPLSITSSPATTSAFSAATSARPGAVTQERLIIGNTITGNTYNGIWLDSSSGVTVSANFLSGNGQNNDGDGGIALTGSTNNVLLANVSQNNNGSGIFLDADSSNNFLLSNSLRGNAMTSPRIPPTPWTFPQATKPQARRIRGSVTPATRPLLTRVTAC